VLQCSRYLLLVPAGASIRASLQPSPNIVCLTKEIHCDGANGTSADLEMTVNMLIQIDKLVQLLESPVFTCRNESTTNRR